MPPLRTLLEKWYRRFRRHEGADSGELFPIWFAAFELAYFIVADRQLATELAFKSLRTFEEQRPARLHRLRRRASYWRRQAANATARKPVLRDDHAFDISVLFEATRYELKKQERSAATGDDFDVWFMKCVITHCYGLRGDLHQFGMALHLAVAMGAVFHNFSLKNIHNIWNELADLVERTREVHEGGSDHYTRYLREFVNVIRERFPQVADERNGFRRRTPDPHAQRLMATCFERFELRDTRELCLDGCPKTFANDDDAETARLHVLSHLDCFDRLLRAQIKPLSRKDHATLAQFDFTDDVRSDDDVRRKPAALTPGERTRVDEGLREYLTNRPNLVITDLSVSVEGQVVEVVPRRSLRAGATIDVVLPFSSRMLRIWARQPDGTEALLASRLLSCVVDLSDVELSDGRLITFLIRQRAEGIGLTCEIEIVPAGTLRAAWNTVALGAGRLGASSWARLPQLGAVAAVVLIILWLLPVKRLVQNTAAVTNRPAILTRSEESPFVNPFTSRPKQTDRGADASHVKPSIGSGAGAKAMASYLPTVYLETFAPYDDEKLDHRMMNSITNGVNRGGHYSIVTAAGDADFVVREAGFRTAATAVAQFRVYTRGEFVSASASVQLSEDHSKETAAKEARALTAALIEALEQARTLAKK